MGVGFGEELHAVGFDQFFHAVDKLGDIEFELFQRHARYGECHFEFSVGVFNHFEQGLVGRQIGALGYTRDNIVIGEIIVIVVVVADVEEAIPFQSERLVDLKIETNSFHMRV